MNRQGGRAADPSRPEGLPDWWRRLYHDTATDTGGTTSQDTLDDRFASAVRTVRDEPVALHPTPTRRGTKPSSPATTATGTPAAPGRRQPPPGPPPATDVDQLACAIPDTVLDGAEHGGGTLRTASVRGARARTEAEPRRDVLVSSCLGQDSGRLLLVAMATATRPGHGARRAAHLLCDRIVQQVRRSATQLAEDVGVLRRDALASGLRRLVDRAYATLREQAVDLGLAEPGTPARSVADLADVRCLLLPGDPRCAARVCFGTGDGGLFRLRDGAWRDLEASSPHALSGTTPAGAVRKTPAPSQPQPPPAPPPGDRHGPHAAPAVSPAASPGELAAADGFRPAPPPPAPRPFRFEALHGRPGDTLLLCSPGLARPLREVPSFAEALAQAWAAGSPGLPDFLASLDTHVPGYGEDRTAAALWESSAGG